MEWVEKMAFMNVSKREIWKQLQFTRKELTKGRGGGKSGVRRAKTNKKGKFKSSRNQDWH